MRHMNDQYCPKVLLYGCIKLFVPQYDFFMTKIILYRFYLFIFEAAEATTAVCAPWIF